MQNLLKIDGSVENFVHEKPKPKRAAIPKWLVYDASQEMFFGTPMTHERRFSGLLSIDSYAGPWVSSFIKKLRSLESTTLSSDKISLYMMTGNNRLVLSNLIFDNWIVFYRIHELMFWSLVWECVDKNIELFVISNPVPLVCKAFTDLATLNFFEFTVDSSLGMSIDLKTMKSVLSTVPDDVKATHCMNIHNNPPARTRLVKLLPLKLLDSTSDSRSSECNSSHAPITTCSKITGSAATSAATSAADGVSMPLR